MTEIVCALCDHPHGPGWYRCRHRTADGFICDCPGYERPADETED